MQTAIPTSGKAVTVFLAGLLAVACGLLALTSEAVRTLPPVAPGQQPFIARRKKPGRARPLSQLIFLAEVCVVTFGTVVSVQVAVRPGGGMSRLLAGFLQREEDRDGKRQGVADGGGGQVYR